MSEYSQAAYEAEWERQRAAYEGDAPMTPRQRRQAYLEETADERYEEMRMNEIE